MVQKHCTNLCAKIPKNIYHLSDMKKFTIPQFNTKLSINTWYLFLDTAYTVLCTAFMN
jgi:hypothetical protein